MTMNQLIEDLQTILKESPESAKYEVLIYDQGSCRLFPLRGDEIFCAPAAKELHLGIPI